MMTLRQQRCLFTLLKAQLVVWVHNNLPGYELAENEVLRTQTQADANKASGAGISKSLHLLGLASDFNLYINGVYQTTSEAHRPIGQQWKKMHELARWGGEFKDSKGNPKPDGNHYSLEWEGRK